jgi:hypothetical protein
MVITFGFIASLATIGAGLAVRANQFGRVAALVLFGIFVLTLLSSSLAERFSHPTLQSAANYLCDEHIEIRNLQSVTG